MKKWGISVLLSFVIFGLMVSGFSVFAAPDDKGNPFDKLQKQIDDIVNGKTPLQGQTKVVSLGNGLGGLNIMSTYACGSKIQLQPLTACTRNIPMDGTLTDLAGSTMGNGQIVSPGIGKSYELTVVVNGLETDLSCTIADEESVCQNTSDAIKVEAGDRIDLKITNSEHPARANIAGSVLLRP